MNKIMKNVLIVLLVIVLITGIVLLLNPLMRSEKGIRKYMLKFTPIGTSMEDVIKIVEDNEKWIIRNTRDYGYGFSYGIPIRSQPAGGTTVIGVKSIVIYVGKYCIIFNTYVSVFYAFDEDSKLIDIAVLKETDVI